MKDTPVEVRTQTQYRAASYGFLTWLFLEQPDGDFVARMLADDAQDSLHLLASGSKADSKILTGLEMMRSSLEMNGRHTIEDTCLALAVEHTRLLRGVARDYGPPPPYESLYRSAEVSSEVSFLVQVAEFYRHAQVNLPAERADRIDYLGLELDLMRLLCEEESRAFSQGDTAEAERFAVLQQRFLREHLLAWAPHFCELWLTQTTAGFYQGVAQLLLGFLEEESMIDAKHPYASQKLSDVPQAGIGKAR